MVVASLQFSSEFLEALVAEVLEAVSKCQSILIEYQQYSQFKNPLVEGQGWFIHAIPTQWP